MSKPKYITKKQVKTRLEEIIEAANRAHTQAVDLLNGTMDYFETFDDWLVLRDNLETAYHFTQSLMNQQAIAGDAKHKKATQ